MRGVLIDPSARTVSAIEVRPQVDYFGEKPRQMAKLPRGDVLLAGADAGTPDAFVIGGSAPIAGPALIVGRRIDSGERGPALIELHDVITMVRWTSIEIAEPAGRAVNVRAILIDPELRSIEEVRIAPNVLAVQRLMGCEVGVCFRAPGGDRVLAAKLGPRDVWHWRKDDAAFNSRCVVVGHDSRTRRFGDVATSIENMRTSVAFRGPGESNWTNYEDRTARGKE